MSTTYENFAKFAFSMVCLVLGIFLATKGLHEILNGNMLPWLILGIIGFILFLVFFITNRNWFFKWEKLKMNILFCTVLLVVIGISYIIVFDPF